MLKSEEFRARCERAQAFFVAQHFISQALRHSGGSDMYCHPLIRRLFTIGNRFT